jgi:hypothetical protein
MGMTAEDALRSLRCGVGQCPGGNFAGHAQPGRVQPLEKAGETLFAKIQLLNLQVKRHEKIAERKIIYHQAVKLVSVNCQMAVAAKIPDILLEDFHAHQVRHDVGKPLVMVAFDPHHFDFALGIGEFADVTEKLPVFFFEAAEVQIAENVAQQNETAEGNRLQGSERGICTAHLRPQVQIGENHRVEARRLHASFVQQAC